MHGCKLHYPPLNLWPSMAILWITDEMNRLFEYNHWASVVSRNLLSKKHHVYVAKEFKTYEGSYDSFRSAKSR